jgi:hypothetical protein
MEIDVDTIVEHPGEQSIWGDRSQLDFPLGKVRALML